MDSVTDSCKNGNLGIYKNMQRRELVGDNKNKINIIATDGNWSYHKQVRCAERINVKVNKEKIKDSKGNDTKCERLIRLVYKSKHIW